ncbi:MAG: asparaginase, partial [Planctomycetes bacterium]|nr:asparaginase [Planctomycetota bacterium]
MPRPESEVNPVLLELERGSGVEAFHRGAVCVVRDDQVTYSRGLTDARYYLRSGAKWFQALANVDAGSIDRFGLDDPALALMCASHGGEPAHVAVAQRMLAALEATEGDLVCGPHWPLHAPSAAALRERGEAPGRIHNNCSGKHAGMLMGADLLGAERRGYDDPAHPLQRRILEIMAGFAGDAGSAIEVAIDGCGAPTFIMSLEAMARAYARFGAPPASLPRGWRSGAESLRRAVASAPHLIAGQGRFCTALIESTRGAVLCKVGAEGFYGAMVPRQNLGIAVHVDDGS